MNVNRDSKDREIQAYCDPVWHMHEGRPTFVPAFWRSKVGDRLIMTCHNHLGEGVQHLRFSGKGKRPVNFRIERVNITFWNDFYEQYSCADPFVAPHEFPTQENRYTN